jgi:hypothetical protein
VYGSSYLNIAAAGATDGSQGCLFLGQDLERVNAFRVKARIDGVKHIYNCAPVDLYEHCILKTPLAMRAWALQERLLSPRTLHFSRGQLFWECNEKVACESFPHHLPDDLVPRLTHVKKGSLSESWNRIVKKYSGCQLSKSRDKLVAISGVIRKIVEETHEDCLAGLWWHNMETQLVWMVKEKRPRLTLYRAPSWSWAAIDDEVKMWEYETDHEELKVAILRAHMVPLGRDNLGELCGGALQIACQTIVYGELRNCDKNEDCWHEEEIHLSDNPENCSLNVCWDSSDTRSSLFDVTVAFTKVYLLPITSLAGLLLAATGRKRGQIGDWDIFTALQRESGHFFRRWPPYWRRICTLATLRMIGMRTNTWL